MLAAISEQARLLLGDTKPIVEILRTLRILAINARLKAGRAAAAGPDSAISDSLYGGTVLA